MARPTGTLLVSSDVDARVVVDGQTVARLKAGGLQRLSVSPGEHLVQFTAAGERIELAHRASNRDIFARGALHVAARLKGRAAGRYRVADLL